MIRKEKDANGRGNENGTNGRLSEHELKQLMPNSVATLLLTSKASRLATETISAK
jgi:hypothetical protein